ncbi:hypothetical protein D9M71_637190 [compost metagenome]
MVRRLTHDLPDRDYELIADLLVEKVTHRVHEHFPRLPPSIRNHQGFVIFNNRAVPDDALVLFAGQPLIFKDAHGF